ncbi:hypothetical protein [Mycobacterium tuberculosis]|uniref:hypothetical protein n=1 Tax=Mycobacterium tuberculosis TaxID=1773 RepID=UPI00272D5E18|nr:hypothetical protein [Mycobacterium tuberculosis]
MRERLIAEATSFDQRLASFGLLASGRPILASLRKQLGAWPVSAAAIAIGTRAYQDIACSLIENS